VNAPLYTYSDAGNNALQQAIWWLEYETDAYIGGPVAGSENSFNNYLVTAAVNATGAGTAANARTINAAYGEWGVAVLTLYSPGPPEIKNQDMLALVPEPTTMVAGALLLLPFAASTVRFIRKNRAV